MKLTYRQIKKGMVVVDAEGRIDVASSPYFLEELKKIVDSGNIKMVIDFRRIDYISSAGLRVLISIGKLVKSLQGELRLCGLSSHIMDIFTMTGFTKIFTICHTDQEAIYNW